MKRFITHYWPIFGLIIIVLIIGYYIGNRHKKIVKKARSITNMLPSYGVQLKDVHYTHDEPGKEIKWELDAKKVIFSRDRSIIKFYDFHLILNSNGKREFDLKGKEGGYERKKNMIFLKGDLIAVYKGGYKLYTDSFLFNEENGQGRSEDPVRIKGPFFMVDGKGLFLDLKKKIIKVLSHVNSLVQETS